MNIKGGVGTVNAIVIAHEILINHAVISTQKRNGWLL